MRWEDETGRTGMGETQDFLGLQTSTASSRQRTSVADLQTILFDFDGTLVRTREASWELFRQTNEKFALGVDTPSAFFQLFDRNFYAVLDEASANNGAAEDVRRHFQALLRTEYSPQFVPGMTKVVKALAAHYTLIVLSSNTMEAVRRILLANEVATCFAHVFSGELAPRKNEAIAGSWPTRADFGGSRRTPHYEESMVPRLHEPSEAMLITDTVGDVIEALDAGIWVGGGELGHARGRGAAAGARRVRLHLAGGAGRLPPSGRGVLHGRLPPAFGRARRPVAHPQ